MIEAPINPPDELEERAECPCCKESFVVWSPEFVTVSFFAWWDEDEKEQLCSLECRNDYEKEYGWEYEELKND